MFGVTSVTKLWCYYSGSHMVSQTHPNRLWKPMITSSLFIIILLVFSKISWAPRWTKAPEIQLTWVPHYVSFHAWFPSISQTTSACLRSRHFVQCPLTFRWVWTNHDTSWADRAFRRICPIRSAIFELHDKGLFISVEKKVLSFKAVRSHIRSNWLKNKQK